MPWRLTPGPRACRFGRAQLPFFPIDGRLYSGMASPFGLIGRRAEWRVLEAVLAAVRGGDSQVLVVHGEAGIGKSALLQHLVEAASGFTVARVIGVESEMALPFAGLHQLCAPMLDHLGTLPDPQRDALRTAFGLTSGAAPDRLLLGLAVLNLLSAVADDEPVLCVVDDAHWLDRESAQTFSFVARRVLAEPIGVVFATREPDADLETFPQLPLGGVSGADARTLLQSVLPVPLDQGVKERIIAEARGNPLALVEWARGRTPAELAGGFGTSAMPTARRIQETFRHRLAELPEPAQRFLTIVAAEPTGDPVIVWRAADALGVGPRDVDPAVDAGLIEIGVRVSFRHPLVRSAVYGSVAPADRQAAHRALGAATDPSIDPDRRAWHRALGCPGFDEDVADALEQSAGRATARGGLAAAAALLERSAQLTNDPARRVRRLLAAADSHLESGSFEAGAGLLAAAEAVELDDASHVRVELLRARYAMYSGEGVRDGPDLLRRAARRAELLDQDLAANSYLWAISAATVVGSFANGAGMREIALAAVDRPQPSDLTVQDQLVTGLALLRINGPAAATPVLRLALASTDDEIVGPDAYGRLGSLASAAVILWDIEALRKIAVSCVAATREVGALRMLPVALNTLAHLRVLEGELDAARSALSEAKQIMSLTRGNLFITITAVLAGLEGAESAAPLIDAEIDRLRRDGLGGLVPSALWSAALLRNGLSQYDHAFALGAEAIEMPGGPADPFFFAELIEAAVRCGQREPAVATLARLTPFTEASGSDWALGVQRRSEALLAEDAIAEDLYRESIDRLARTTLRPDLGRAELLYGEWLRRENRRVEARAPLRAAHELFTAVGMQAFAERARHELAATGETVKKRSPQSFDELTSQEAHIALLAADGHTNAEIGSQLFISARTVEWHLRKVFSKLDVASRRQLRDALQRRTSMR